MNRNALIQFVQKLIQIPSSSGEEGGIIQFIQGKMQALGFDETVIDKNGTLIGFIYGAKPGACLLLDAHCDTVGVAAGSPWQVDPYGGAIKGRRIYGRGSSDMKGALAGMVYAASSIDREQIAGSIVVSVTVMEEVMEGVSLKAVIDRVKPDFVIIGEATELNLNHGGRGRAELSLEAAGKPAHSSSPHLGVNAVHRILPAIAAIEQMPLGSDPLLGDAIIALTDIISDPYPGASVIPSRCRVTYDRRLLAGETMASVLSDFVALPALDGLKLSIVEGNHQTYSGATLAAPKFFPAWKFSPQHPFVQKALAGLKEADLAPKLQAYSFCTNGAYSAGVAGIPTVGFGPSSEGLAHIVDEYIEIDQLLAAAVGYAGIIRKVLA